MDSKLFTYKDLGQDKLDYIFSILKKLRVGLLGDVSLDVYWQADMKKSELSRETPHFPLPIVQERMSPGAGGNVAANIKALGVASIKVVSVIGNDWRANALLDEFQKRGINTSLIIRSDQLTTNAYCKPIRSGISEVEYEDPRLDFANYETLPEEEEEKLLHNIDLLSKNVDVICVADQLVYGCITAKVRDKIALLKQKGIIVIVDSRDRVALYDNVILKPNEVEGVKAMFPDMNIQDADNSVYLDAAQKLHQKNNCSVCMTLGDSGCLYVNKSGTVYIPTKKVTSPIDICGAGDTFISAFACALATGVKGYEAAFFANIAASIIVKKIGMTGTATQKEIIQKYNQIYNINEE